MQTVSFEPVLSRLLKGQKHILLAVYASMVYSRQMIQYPFLVRMSHSRLVPVPHGTVIRQGNI